MKYFKTYSQKNLIDITKELKRIEIEIINKYNLQMFLTFGTLLGVIREGDYIKHDNDIDVGVYFGKHSNNHARELIKKWLNYLSINKLWITKKNMAQFKLQTNFGYIDCWSCWTDTDNKIHLGGLWHGVFCHENIFPFKQIKLHGYKFNIPNQSEILLNKWFDNWKVPCKDKGSKNAHKMYGKTYKEYLKNRGENI